jgi:sphinganine-1-phosphate aldolase
MPKEEIISILDRYSKKDEAKWRHGRVSARTSHSAAGLTCRRRPRPFPPPTADRRAPPPPPQVSGAVYHGGDALTALMTEAFSRYALSNPLHPDVFPYLRKMEAECVAMTVALFHGGPDACGTMTSGGTESILMACKAYRDYARSTRGVTEPELVVPVTAHAAFDKACHYFGIRLVHVDVDPVTFRSRPEALAAAITSNTIALVSSAPSYPQGVIDPITEVAAIATKHNLPLHVDCCLGSYCVAFAAAAGYPTVPFDFAVPGVTSISVDTHKYGFAPKGSSIVLYSESKYRHAQYFVAPEWTGGIYASPSIAGSRPGALIAACWATLMSIGAEGYTQSARKIIGAARTIADGIRGMDAICLYGEPDLSVVCFGPRPGGPKLNIYNVGDALTARGWNLNVMQAPASIHICVTYANADSAQAFLTELAAAVQDVLTAPPGKFKDGTGAIYGMAAAIPDKSVVNQVAYGFLDALYAHEAPEA